MKRLITVLLLLSVAISAFGSGSAVVSGQTLSGAYYRFEVPATWVPADGLVLWNHGYNLGSPGILPDPGPLAAIQLAEGYAIAAISFSVDGWSLFGSMSDLQQLMGIFVSTFAEPDQVLIYGASTGGLVSVQAAESGRLGNVSGVMTMCAPLAGSRIWDGMVDLRLLYDAVCQGIPDAQIPGGAGGLPDPLNPAFDQVQLSLAVNACTGVLLNPASRSAQQQQNLDQLTGLTSIPEEFLLTDMAFATFGMHQLVFDDKQLRGVQAMDNSTVTYADLPIDQLVERVTADQEGRNRLFNHYTPDGGLHNSKVVALHTDKDGLFFVENTSDYSGKAIVDQFVAGIVVEDSPSHCGFTEAETVSAWETLRGWVAGLPEPTAQNLQDTCNALVAGGLAEGPCRIDPAYVVQSLDSRIPVRSGFKSLPIAIPAFNSTGVQSFILVLLLTGLLVLRQRR